MASFSYDTLPLSSRQFENLEQQDTSFNFLVLLVEWVGLNFMDSPLMVIGMQMGLAWTAVVHKGMFH